MLDLPTARFQEHTLVRIGDDHAGGSMLLLAPEAGGRLVRWRHHGEDILYWPNPADWSNPAKIRGGNPILFPFIGRHFVDGEPGRWRDAGGQVHALPQHGFARDLPFEVESADRAHIVLLLRDGPQTRAGYPFAFEFRVSYRLLEDGLEATFSVTHAAEGDTHAPMPFYAGHHFYFALPCVLRHATTLQMPPSRLSRQLADGSLDTPQPGHTLYTLDTPALQDRYHLLDGAGAIVLDIPPHPDAPLGRRIRIEIDGALMPWHAITTWTESETSDFYCIEPWMGLPNAVHHGEGLHLLAPGDTRHATCRLRIARQSASG
ncbi:MULTISPECIES: aldose epimerase [Ralstonia solanacearum species complex]|nr:aldose epimerase [Ralstonia solanacearum]ALF88456.1 Putative glucose-6-phosphate 1-epimerase [Ralstonia solanacearum]ATI27907.1 aldose epimerase [Ralstonia solanacearum]KEI32806.1 aldose epimerase [Ralstonia solanacearum]KFX77306.1 aldose epimerase [Ralstonia solanacearum]KFX83176.1 aldose epimerase [Ralstonia solanacearum]